MKKHLVLLILCVLVLFTGCMTMGDKHIGPGRTILNVRNSLIEHEQDLKNIARKYQITRSVKVAVIGADRKIVSIAKEVFNDFGFLVVQENYEGPLLYEIVVEKEDIGGRYSRYRGFGHSTNSRVVVKVKLTVFDDEVGVEYYYTGLGEYGYSRYYQGYYRRSVSYQVDPTYLASKAATTIAVANFIDGIGVPYKVSEK